MHFSYWEQKSFLGELEHVVIGGGITGLTAAYHLKKRFPFEKVTLVERSWLSAGASSRNAGFACFGSCGEILEDLKTLGAKETANLVRKRKAGLDALFELLGKDNIGFEATGSWELFERGDTEWNTVRAGIEELNLLLQPVFKKTVFSENTQHPKKMGLPGIENSIFHSEEGLIDTGKMLKGLAEKAKNEGVEILQGMEILELQEAEDHINLNTPYGRLKAQKVYVANNAFAKKLIDVEVTAVRNQVLLSKPISGLQLKGAFHHEKGYVYMRHIENRILIGGARHRDSEKETTDQFGPNAYIEDILTKAAIKWTGLNGIAWDMKWSGILGVGEDRAPIVKAISPRIAVGVKLGGMGVAIGSLVGKELSQI